MQDAKTHFERIPLETVKKIAREFPAQEEADNEEHNHHDARRKAPARESEPPQRAG